MDLFGFKGVDVNVYVISLLFSSTIPSGSSVVPLSLQVPPIILLPKSAQ